MSVSPLTLSCRAWRLRTVLLGTGLTLGFSLGLWSGPARAQAPLPTPPGTFRLPGHVPALVKRASLMGRLPGAQPVSLAISLPLRNPDDLDALLARLYDPSDPQYGHYLTPEQFAAQFGPTQADYDAVRRFADSHGLAVTGTHPNRALLDVSGPASSVEAAFALHLLSYRDPDGRAFYAPDSDPALPGALAGRVQGIIGLDNAALPRPADLEMAPALPDVSPALTPAIGPSIGTGLGDGLSPNDVKTAYDLSPVTATGKGQTLALMELDTYTASDVTAYEDQYGLPHVTLNNVAVDGGVAAPGGGAKEVTLDIELAIALAAGVTQVNVYVAPNNWAASADCYNKIATDDSALQISTSWGTGENETPASVRTAEDTAFKQMATQGQSMYAASGDSAAYQGVDSNDDATILEVLNPASQGYVTGVGGTTLSLNGDGTYASESAWNDPYQHYQDPGSPKSANNPYLPHGVGGGGGISSLTSLPDYQSGAVKIATKGSTTMRNVPDVSLDSDPYTGYSIYFNGEWTSTGGTSAAAPVWAGFTALVNQQRKDNGQAALGFANPTLYALASGPDYGLAFHDIADNSTNAYYPAVSGYDDATGLGSFNGANLFSFLTGLYAEEGFRGAQHGTLLNPYATIQGALNAAPATPVNLFIKGGSYGENLTIDRPIHLINYGSGLVTLGS